MPWPAPLRTNPRLLLRLVESLGARTFGLVTTTPREEARQADCKQAEGAGFGYGRGRWRTDPHVCKTDRVARHLAERNGVAGAVYDAANADVAKADVEARVLAEFNCVAGAVDYGVTDVDNRGVARKTSPGGLVLADDDRIGGAILNVPNLLGERRSPLSQGQEKRLPEHDRVAVSVDDGAERRSAADNLVKASVKECTFGELDRV